MLGSSVKNGELKWFGDFKAEGTTIAGTWRSENGARLTVPTTDSAQDFDVVYESPDGRKILKLRATWTTGMSGIELHFHIEGEEVVATFNPCNPGQLRL